MVTIDNVLDATPQDLEALSTGELKALLHAVKDKADGYDTLQFTDKILINSLYGAMGNLGFILFNEKIAQAITGNGRYFIQLCANNINKVLSEKLGKEYEFVFYGDTDSVVGSTILRTSKGEMTIRDLYDSQDNEVTLKNGVKIKPVKSLNSLSMSCNKELEDKNILYVMKHKVHKRIYRIKTKTNYIDITEDHSLIVLRNDRLISVKPQEIIKGDMIYEAE